MDKVSLSTGPNKPLSNLLVNPENKMNTLESIIDLFCCFYRNKTSDNKCTAFKPKHMKYEDAENLLIDNTKNLKTNYQNDRNITKQSMSEEINNCNEIHQRYS